MNRVKKRTVFAKFLKNKQKPISDRKNYPSPTHTAIIAIEIHHNSSYSRTTPLIFFVARSYLNAQTLRYVALLYIACRVQS